MLFNILLLAHICGAVIGITAGVLAMVLRKGSGLHSAAGNVFAVSLLVMSGTAAYMAAFFKPSVANVIVGVLTFYMVSTGWRAARRRETRPTTFDTIAFFVVLIDGAAAVTMGLRAVIAGLAKTNGVPTPMYFIFGTIALLFAMSDARMIGRGGADGPKRIRRHVVRMSLALLLAIFSLFPGQSRLFPEAWRYASILYAPHIFIAVSMFFWLWRMRTRKLEERSNRIEQTYDISTAAVKAG
jgi:hypothetical protein